MNKKLCVDKAINLIVLVVLFQLFNNSILLAQFDYSGTAKQTDVLSYQLTGEKPQQTGAIWHQKAINLNDPFDLKFELSFGCKNKVGEGIAFVFQQKGKKALGTGKNSLGYGQLQPSLAIEFDTHADAHEKLIGYKRNHITLVANGLCKHSSNNMLIPATFIKKNLTDCKTHQARISWWPSQKKLKVYLDGKEKISYEEDWVSAIFGKNPIVYWGFTAATGAYQGGKQDVHIRTNLLALAIEKQAQTAKEKGFIKVKGLNGGSNYTYNWSTGSSQQTLTELRAGNYQVTVTDAWGESIVQDIKIDYISDNQLLTKQSLASKKVDKKKQKTTSKNVRATIKKATQKPVKQNNTSKEKQKQDKKQKAKEKQLKKEQLAKQKEKEKKVKKEALIRQKAEEATKKQAEKERLTKQKLEETAKKKALAEQKAKEKQAEKEHLAEQKAKKLAEEQALKAQKAKQKAKEKAKKEQEKQAKKIAKAKKKKTRKQKAKEKVKRELAKKEELEAQARKEAQEKILAEREAKRLAQEELFRAREKEELAALQQKPVPKQKTTEVNLPKTTIKTTQVGDLAKTQLINQLVPTLNTEQQPVTLDQRAVKLDKRILVNGRKIELSIGEAEYEDGDVISLYLNGKWILKNQLLSKQKKKVTVQLNSNSNKQPQVNNYLVMYAHTEGKRPLCTATIIISDGKKERYVRLSADLQTCDSVFLDYKK